MSVKWTRRGSCSCGWRGPWREADTDARADTQKHCDESPDCVFSDKLAAQDGDDLMPHERKDHYDCSTCGQRVFMGDLAAVMFHEHRGITDRVDLSNIAPGKRVSDQEDKA